MLYQLHRKVQQQGWPIQSVALAFALALGYGPSPATAQESHRTDLQIPQSGFVHPGLLHSREDLERMKKNVEAGVEPWASAWKAFQSNRLVAKDYRPSPLAICGRGVGSTGQSNISQDAAAAYYLAIAWYISGDEAYAKKSIEILNAWASTCKEINGKDAVLCAGLYGNKFANAAEIMRHCYNKWPQEDVAKFKLFLQTVVYPVVKDFATYANGNWDACSIQTVMSIGIFCDDRAMFDRSIRYYLDGAGDGSLLHYVVNEAGQCQESGRDQAHTQLGLGLLTVACETAYHQGIDLYSAENNRLLAGLEYTAKYNMFGDVPFEPLSDFTGKYTAKEISRMGRGRASPIWEIVVNHYQNRLGIAAPFSAQMAAKRRPEVSSLDQPGMGTLLFTLPEYHASTAIEAPNSAPAIPGPVIAKQTAGGIKLKWAPSLAADHYLVKRSAMDGGLLKTLGDNVKSSDFLDKVVQPGAAYRYAVCAVNSAGASGDTLPASIVAGLPQPWQEHDVGSVLVAGSVGFDGSTFKIEASGKDIAGSDDQMHLVYQQLKGNGAVTARFVPQVASQFAKFGLTMREGLNADAAQVSLLFVPEAGRDVEQPGWYVNLLTRNAAGQKLANAGTTQQLSAPYAMWGRLMEPYWLRLSRSGNEFTASTSPDGKNWTKLGAATIPLDGDLLIGLAACSRLPKTTTRVMFDNVLLDRSSGTQDPTHPHP
ncbi:MAG TPA: alginate lyase family protein [Pirellulales bacterium]|jgi:regulation of enolase protein 1 (concanavalin A-like superfamily)